MMNSLNNSTRVCLTYIVIIYRSLGMREHLKRHKEAHERAHQWAHRQATGMKMNLFDGLWDDDDMDFIGTDGMPEFGHLDSMFGGGGDLHEFVNREGVHIG